MPLQNLGNESLQFNSHPIHKNYFFYIARLRQQCHNSVTTVSQQCHNSVTTVSQQCHNSKFVIFQETLLKGLKCLWVQRRHNCSPAASFANCLMTLHLLKVCLQTFLSIPITQKCQILSCDTLVVKERYHSPHWTSHIPNNGFIITTNKMQLFLIIYFKNSCILLVVIIKSY